MMDRPRFLPLSPRPLMFITWLALWPMWCAPMVVFSQDNVPSVPSPWGPRVVTPDGIDDWQLGPYRSFLLGRIVSYRINAYDDYEISTLIVEYVSGGRVPDVDHVVGKRAFDYIADLNQEVAPSVALQRMLVRAYTLRWINGHTNLMWARFLERFHLIRPRLSGTEYGDAETGGIELFSWAFVLRGDTAPIADFVSQYVPFTLSPEQVSEEILHIQHHNSLANALTSSLLVGETRMVAPRHRKVEYLRSVAEVSRRPRLFLRGAAAGQHGAGRWDGIFARLIRRRLRTP